MSHKVRRNKLQKSMSNKSKIILVRHGESTCNLNDQRAGWSNPGLSELGRKQAELLAEALKGEQIDIIISSDLLRAKKTTEAIVKYHDVDTRYVEALRERCHGIFDGKATSEFLKAEKESGQKFHQFRPEDGESLESLLIRASNFWRFWAPQAKNNTILLSGHGIFTRILLIFLTGKTFDDWEALDQNNACINIISENEKGVYLIDKINDTSHLAALNN